MATVKNKFTGDADQLAKELERVRRQMSKLEDAQDRMVAQSKRSDKASRRQFKNFQSGLKNQVKGLATMAVSWQTVTGALQIYNAELQLKNQLEEQGRQKALTVAQSQAALLKNTIDLTPGQRTNLIDEIRQLRGEVGFQSVAPLNTAAGELLSATSADPDKTLGILRTAAPFFRDDQAELAAFGGALADLMKSSGIQDAKAATAFGLAIQGQARFTDLGGFKQVAPALASAEVARASGDRLENARRAAALFAAIGGETGDVDAAITKTAITGIFAGMARATADKGDLSFEERLGLIRQDPERQAEATKTGFRGATKLLAEEFFADENSQIAQAFRGALGKIKIDESKVDELRNTLTGGTAELAVSAANKAAEGSIEEFDLEAADAGTAREILKQRLLRTANFFARRGDLTRFDLGGGGIDLAIETLQRQIQREQDNKRELPSGRVVETFQVNQADVQFLREGIDILRDMKNRLDRINQDQNQGTPAPGNHEERD